MKWYFKITRFYVAWGVGKGGAFLGDVQKSWIRAAFSFLVAYYRMCRYKPVNVLKFKYGGSTQARPGHLPLPPDVESVRAATVNWGEYIPPPIVDWLPIDTPPGPIISQHFGPEDDAAAVAILTGRRQGVEYHECPECGQETYYQADYETKPGGGLSCRMECENPDCGYMENFSA